MVTHPSPHGPDEHLMQAGRLQSGAACWVSAHPESVEGCPSKLPMVSQAHHKGTGKDFAIFLLMQGRTLRDALDAYNNLGQSWKGPENNKHG